MKVSNLKFTKKVAYSLLLTGLAAIISTLFINGSSSRIYCIPILFFVILLIYLFTVLKSTCLELSGGCISVRTSHPLSFKKFINPSFEIPFSKLLGFNFVTKLIITRLVLKILSKREKKFLMKISLWGFTQVQKNKIKTSLTTVTGRTDNDQPTIPDHDLKTVA